MNRFWKYTFPAIYGLLVYFTIRVLLDTATGGFYHILHRGWLQNGSELAISMADGYLVIGLFRLLFRYFDTRWPAGFSYKRIARELFYVFLVTELVSCTTIMPFAAFTDDGLQVYDVADILIIPLMYALMYYGIVRSSTFLKAYIDNKLKLEQITNDHLQTELKFLKAQYHPHFLFNALNTIYFQMDENVAEAKKSVEKFSELLRYQLYDQQQTVSVSQEIHYLENFIQLQQARTSEKLRLEVNFDKSLNGQQVYPLLFLPLVENAFKYVGGEYHLQVRAHQTGNRIEFKVENSVPAIIPVKKEGGIGLENLRRRLELLYPGRHSLVAEKEGDTFVASLNIELN
jgi:two-component system, LytTR family, sensor kinase